MIRLTPFLTATATIALLTGAGIAQTASVPLAAPAAAPAVTSALPATQALYASYIATNKMPGIVGAFRAGNSPTMFVSAGKIATDANAAPAGPDSLWRVYSMTKPITAMAAMILIEQGKMKLDEPVSDFIPAFKSMRVVDSPAALAPTHPAPRPITIRNLLTHTSGLTYQIIGTGPLPTEYKRLGLLGGRVDAEASKVQPQSLAAFADRLATVPLLADPGTEWHYSVSLDVLGRVIEVASGVPFDRFVESRILKPLGMSCARRSIIYSAILK